MYTSKSVSQRSAIFNPEEIQTDRVLFSLDGTLSRRVSTGTPRRWKRFAS